jgi:hypothetical protein
MILGTVLAGATGTFRLPYCPETLFITGAAVPARVQVRALGEGVILDLDAAGLTLLQGMRLNTNVATFYRLPLADGFLVGKNIEIDVTANAAQPAVVHEFSTGDKGTNYLLTERTTVLANTSQTFDRFFGLGLSAVNAGDQITVNYKSGLSQTFNAAAEIQALAIESNNQVLFIDNFDSEIVDVKVVPTAQITVYKVSYKI